MKFTHGAYGARTLSIPALDQSHRSCTFRLGEEAKSQGFTALASINSNEIKCSVSLPWSLARSLPFCHLSLIFGRNGHSEILISPGTNRFRSLFDIRLRCRAKPDVIYCFLQGYGPSFDTLFDILFGTWPELPAHLVRIEVGKTQVLHSKGAQSGRKS